MNLNHRVADKQSFEGLDVVMHKIQYPLTLVLPLGLTIVSFFSVRYHFGAEWDIGPFSTPFIPFISQQFANIIQLDWSVIASSLIISLYALGALSFYFFVFALTKRHLPAIITSLLSMVPVIPFSNQAPERLSLALLQEDGAHVAAFSLSILALTAFFVYLRKEKIAHLIVFTLISFVVILLSFFATFVLWIMMLFLALSEMLVGQGKLKVKRFGIGILSTFGLLVIVYNVSIVKMLVSSEGQTTLAVVTNFIPLTFFLIPLFGTFFFLIFDRRPQLQSLFLSLVLTLLFGILHVVRLSLVDVSLLDQDRYATELSFGLPFFLAIVVTWLFDFARTGKIANSANPKTRFFGAVGIVVAILLLLVFSVVGIERTL